MRELVLNHASLGVSDRLTAVGWLKDMTAGLAALVRYRVAAPALRMRRYYTEIACLPDLSLWDLMQEMRRAGAREEFILFSKLTAKCPLLLDVEPDIKDRFLSCETTELPPSDGEPLTFCVITNGISVGFPSSEVWDSDSINVIIRELLPNDSFQEASETIDSLTRSVHAQSIHARHRAHLRDILIKCRNGLALWNAREKAFPNLMFGPDVEEQLADLNPQFLPTVVDKLASLDQSSAKWSQAGMATPPWRIKVTDESSSVKNDRRLLERRRFAHYGNAGRIHLHFDLGPREIEIGYIGNHLPL